jgi:hypothetical protein
MELEKEGGRSERATTLACAVVSRAHARARGAAAGPAPLSRLLEVDSSVSHESWPATGQSAGARPAGWLLVETGHRSATSAGRSVGQYS